MTTPDRAIIIGGGVGGLSTAVALQRAGMEATIFERAPKLIDVGCVQLWTNGMVALAQLDLADEALS
ncbi:MAG: FAD-dependent oxidoreductase, partial [Gaiellaceae bacterium]